MNSRKWKKNFRLITLSLVISSLLIAFSYDKISGTFETTAYPAPGALVDLGGYRLHMQDMGTGPVTIVLDAGMACCSLDWSLVQPEIAKFTRVVSYDRAGYGWSDESPLPRTSRNIVGELHHLLQAAKIPPPYILVGHSFGGANVRLYANSYPEEVAGIILVDSAHEEHFQKMPVWPRRLIERFLIQPPVVTLGATFGFVRIFNYFMDVRKTIKSLPEEIQDMYLAHMSTTKYVKTVAQEFSYFSASLQQIQEAPKIIGDKPLVVISAGQHIISEDRGYDREFLDEITQIWRKFQIDLVGKSSKGKQIIAEKSGHMISHQQPDLIVEIVHEMLGEIEPTYR